MAIFSSNDTFWILLFLYYSFGVEKTNTFIRSRGSLENHTRFKTIMVKIYTGFQTKMAQKPCIPFGAAHTYIAYIGEYPPPPPLGGKDSRILLYLPDLKYTTTTFFFIAYMLHIDIPILAVRQDVCPLNLAGLMASAPTSLL